MIPCRTDNRVPSAESHSPKNGHLPAWSAIPAKAQRSLRTGVGAYDLGLPGPAHGPPSTRRRTPPRRDPVSRPPSIQSAKPVFVYPKAFLCGCSNTSEETEMVGGGGLCSYGRLIIFSIPSKCDGLKCLIRSSTSRIAVFASFNADRSCSGP